MKSDAVEDQVNVFTVRIFKQDHQRALLGDFNVAKNDEFGGLRKLNIWQTACE